MTQLWKDATFGIDNSLTLRMEPYGELHLGDNKGRFTLLEMNSAVMGRCYTIQGHMSLKAASFAAVTARFFI